MRRTLGVVRVLRLGPGIVFALLGLAAGPASEEPPAGRAESPASSERLRESTGRAIEGPGFYVWEETRGEAERWARELGAVPHPEPGDE